jgi:chorismate mutase
MTYEEEMVELREEINRLNREILDRLAERVGVARAIADVKRRFGRSIVDAVRERVVLDQARAQARERGVNPDAVERIYRAIIDLCIEAEESP